MIDRRSFIRASAIVSGAVLAGVAPVLAADAEIEITPREDGPEISAHLYGQFIEHLGGVIYDGIWVGKDSKIPNVGGIRKQFIDDMVRIGVPNFRWPGGCFATPITGETASEPKGRAAHLQLLAGERTGRR